MKKQTQQHQLMSPVATEKEQSLSPVRAFVVQFREETGVACEYFAGRVEHMTSGRAMRFRSSEELLAFFTRVMSATRAKPP